MIIDPNGIAKALGVSNAAHHQIADENASHPASSGKPRTSLLVFRAGTARPEGVPLGLVSAVWKRSPPTRSSSVTVAKWCNTASS
jgi:two-component system, chemotaxis family, sensor kinase CheA